MSIHFTIVNNYSFPPSTLDSAFKIWMTKGITSVSNLFLEGKFASFAQLSDISDLPKSHFFRYLQARHFVQKNFASFPNLPLDNVIDNLLSLSPHQKRVISVLYNHICNISSKSLQVTRELWEDDFEEVMREDQWEAALDLVHTSSPCARHSLIQLKILLRVH